MFIDEEFSAQRIDNFQHHSRTVSRSWEDFCRPCSLLREVIVNPSAIRSVARRHNMGKFFWFCGSATRVCRKVCAKFHLFEVVITEPTASVQIQNHRQLRRSSRTEGQAIRASSIRPLCVRASKAFSIPLRFLLKSINQGHPFGRHRGTGRQRGGDLPGLHGQAGSRRSCGMSEQHACRGCSQQSDCLSSIHLAI